MRLSSREVLSREAADWHHRGIIGRELSEVLQARYDRQGLMLRSLLKWLGLFALVMLGLAILALIGSMLQSAAAGAFLVTMIALGSGMYGRNAALDPLNRHPFMASIFLTAAAGCTYAALMLAHRSAAPEAYRYGEISSFFITALFLTSAVAFGVAYAYRLRWPLLLALLLLFHGIGSWHRYLGHGTYALDIQDPKAMSIIAAVVAALGFFHERKLEEERLQRHAGFGHLYIIFGLLYLNVSVWTLSLHPGGLGWVLVFTALSIAQIVIGARVRDSRFTGFGIVFLSIDMYTRYFEEFWNRTSAGVFFLAAGVLGLFLGYLFERILRSSRLGAKQHE